MFPSLPSEQAISSWSFSLCAFGIIASSAFHSTVQVESKNSFPQSLHAYLSFTPSSVQVSSFPASFNITLVCWHSTALTVWMVSVNSVKSAFWLATNAFPPEIFKSQSQLSKDTLLTSWKNFPSGAFIVTSTSKSEFL